MTSESVHAENGSRGTWGQSVNPPSRSLLNNMQFRNTFLSTLQCPECNNLKATKFQHFRHRFRGRVKVTLP